MPLSRCAIPEHMTNYASRSVPPTLYLRLLSSSPTVLRYTSRSHEAPDTVFWRQVTAESQSAKECVFVLKLMYMLWFNFIPGLNFISLCFGVW